MFDDQNSGTKAVAPQHTFSLETLTGFLEERLPGFKGPLTAEQFKGGQSNPTFRLSTPDRQYVMRMKPGPASSLLPSAHAIEREFRVQKALFDSDVPVAEPLLLCEDESVIGRAFYIMALVEGRVLWDPMLPGLAPAERAAIYDEMNRVIAALHTVDFKARDLESYGKPANYFARQIDRWTRQYKAAETESIPAMDELIRWLPENLPPEDGLISIVHGDYRLDNLIFDSEKPRAVAVLDWELSTLGHPLADFAYHCMAWNLPREVRGMAGEDLTALGIPSEADYLNTYLERTGFTLSGNWNFYHAFNMFRLAGINQGVAKRALDGIASSDNAHQVGKTTHTLANMAWNYAREVEHSSL